MCAQILSRPNVSQLLLVSALSRMIGASRREPANERHISIQRMEAALSK